MAEIAGEVASDKKVKSRWNLRKVKTAANDENWTPQLKVQSTCPRAAPVGAPLVKPKADVLQSTELEGVPYKVETCALTQNSPTQASKEQPRVTAPDDLEYVKAGTTGSIEVQSDEALVEQTGEETELFLNTCCRCGETLLLVIDGGEDFVCEEAGRVCAATAGEPEAGSHITCNANTRLVDSPALMQATDDALPKTQPLRMQLLQQVLAEDLTVLATADLFLSHSEQPPKPSELDACREDIRRRSKERKDRMKSEAAYEDAKAHQKRQQRYVAGQLVDVQKGSKYLTEPKESAAERAKTSISLFIQGSHRGGGHAEKEKKGPRS